MLSLVPSMTQHLGTGLSVGACTWEEASLVQCRDRDMGSEVFVMALKKGRTQPGQCKHRKEAQVNLSGWKECRTQPGSVQSPGGRLRNVCKGFA